MLDVKGLWRRLEAAGAPRTIWSGRRNDIIALGGILAADEEIIKAAQAKYNGKDGTLLMTDRRVLFVIGGFVRHAVESFEYSKVSAVRYTTGIVYGSLTLHTSGVDAVIDKVLPWTQAQPMADHIRDRISAKPAASASMGGSIADELAKLAGLRDQGVLTQTEFDQQKARLLAS